MLPSKAPQEQAQALRAAQKRASFLREELATNPAAVAASAVRCVAVGRGRCLSLQNAFRRTRGGEAAAMFSFAGLDAAAAAAALVFTGVFTYVAGIFGCWYGSVHL